MRSILNALRRFTGTSFDPASLFVGGYDGAYYNFNIISSLWKDTAGTVPVTTAGDAIARADDLKGVLTPYNITNGTAGARPQYNTVAAAMGAIFDGVDDTLTSTAFSLSGTKRTICLAVRDLSDGASSPLLNKTYTSYSSVGYGAIDVRGDGTTIATYGGGGGLLLTQTGFTAPYKASIISECDPSTPILKLMVNGVETSSSTSQSSNTYGSSPIAMGSGQGFAPFGNIEVIAALIINRDLTAGEKASWDTFANGLLGL